MHRGQSYDTQPNALAFSKICHMSIFCWNSLYNWESKKRNFQASAALKAPGLRKKQSQSKLELLLELNLIFVNEFEREVVITCRAKGSWHREKPVLQTHKTNTWVNKQTRFFG